MKSSEFSLPKLGALVRLSLPYGALLVLLLLNMVVIPLPLAGQIHPYFVLMALYYWAIYRPALFSAAICFAVGLLMDVLSGGPLGVQALILVLAQGIVSSQRRFLMGQPYLVLWFFFGVVTVAYGALMWGLWGLAAGHWSFPLPALIDMLASFFLFPFVSLLLVRIHRILPHAS